MTKFESEIKIIYAAQETVYAKLSDLNNLAAIQDRLPADKVKNLHFDADHLSFEVAPVGQVQLEIVEREPAKCIKFGSTQSPVPFNLWIQLLPTSANECKMKITIGAELNMFIKGMVSKPLQEGVNKMADMLAMIPYNS